MHLVVGATGSLGGRIALGLLERGERVRAVVRPSSPARGAGRSTDPAALREAGADLVEADLLRPDTLAPILAGVESVVTTASGTKRPPPDTVPAIDVQGTATLAEAAAAAGARRIMCVSTIGVGPDTPPGLLRAKWEGEEAARRSGLHTVALRPTKFMQDWIGFVIGAQVAAAGRVQLPAGPDPTFSFVDERDVAAVAVEALVQVADPGPVDVIGDYASYPEVVARIGGLLGRDLPIERIPPGAPVTTAPPGADELLTGLIGMTATMPSEEPAPPTTPFGIALRGIDAFLRETFGSGSETGSASVAGRA